MTKRKAHKGDKWLNDITLMIILGMVLTLIIVGTDTHFGFHERREISITPLQIQSIRDIGEWEFLTVTDEEIVDTIRTGFFSDDELARVYTGTLRFGIRADKAKDDWIRMRQDTVEVTLPAIQLLDHRFIDEAATRPFFETGRWSQKARQELYYKAERMMMARCWTQDNIRAAEQSALQHFQQLITALGFEHVDVHF
ncbi:MAG: DUF4230 domain-containing protein [Prevotella sp.]|nr:DUF4230 domain-containing protein [Prevotella sp.]